MLKNIFSRNKNQENEQGTSKEQPQDYWSYVKRQFRKNKRALYSFYFIVFLALIGIFADFLANEKPIFAKIDGKWSAPLFKQYSVNLGLSKWDKKFLNVDWKSDIKYDKVVWPLVPYLPRNLDGGSRFESPSKRQVCDCVGIEDEADRLKEWKRDLKKRKQYSKDKKKDYKASKKDIDKRRKDLSVCDNIKVNIKKLPGYKKDMNNDETVDYCQSKEYSRWRHWLGTDDLGRDVLAGMIHGTRIAFLVGIISMGIAFMIGLFFGAMAGFFGDNDLEMSRGRLILNLLFLPFAFFYMFIAGLKGLPALGAGILLMVIANVLAQVLKVVPWLKRRVKIPLDILITRLIEIVVSVPVLVLILAIVAIAKPSLFIVMIVIGATGWTGIARFIRAELLRVRRLEYIEASRALGFSKLRSMVKHAVPNALSPVFIAIAFGIAGAILVEAFLSFLGIGLPPETITWGKLLSLARRTPDAWWLAIFPGFAIFITVTLFNLIGEGLTDALDPRLKQ